MYGIRNTQMTKGKNTPPIPSRNISAKPYNKAHIQALLHSVHAVCSGAFFVP